MGFTSPLVWIETIGLFASLFFIYRYARYSDWRSTLAGRAIMNLSGSIFITLAYAVFARLTHSHEDTRLWVGFILLAAVDVALINLCRVLVSTQGGFRPGRRDNTTSDRTISQP